MKTLLSILLMGFTLAVSAQNEENNNVVQQQRMDNNIGNMKVPYIRAIKEIQTREKISNNETSQVDLNVNLNLNMPSINLVRKEKINPEKVKPKRVKEFRIKTRYTSSESISHKPKKAGKSFKKKVMKPIRCWAQRTFKHTAKFQLSCECFKF